MFKAKYLKNDSIYPILSVYVDDCGKTWFLVWDNDGWRWRDADNFVPPSYKKEGENEH